MKTFVGARPNLFFPIFRRRSSFESLLVCETTDICIEGVPRSANSFAVGAFEHAQSEPMQVAHHTHVPANPIRACQWGIPTVVLIRDPYDTLVSGVALRKQVQVEERQVEDPIQLLTFHDRLEAYLTFYRSVSPYSDRFLVAPFDTVIRDMGTVIDRVNDRFGTTFERFEHAPKAAQDVHAGPSEKRTEFKKDTQADFDEQLQLDRSLREKMDAAETLYSSFADDVYEKRS